MPGLDAFERFSATSLVDAFFLRGCERTAAGCAEGAREMVRELVRAGRDRAAVGDLLVGTHVASALTLYREAALFYMAARVVAREGEPLRAEEVLARFRAGDTSEVLPGQPPELGTLLAPARIDDLLAVERLTPQAAAEQARSARAIVRRLGRLVEARTVAQVRFDRRVRVGGLALALVVLLWGGVSILGRRENLALHKPVSVSSVHPHATSQPPGLTDGIMTGTYGVHTNLGPMPWVQVDLRDVFAIDEVKIYNRGDGWFDEGLPMTLQFSENGTSFVDVEVRSKSFGQVLPWKADGGGRRARYVRVVGAKDRYVSLSELEVFGRKP